MAIDLLEQTHPHIRSSIYPLHTLLSDWRMKEGDIPDAASVSLKDKSWTSIRIPFQWGKYNKTYWFRQTIKVTPEFAGKPLVLLLDFPDALLYLNGKPYHGINKHHKEILICEKSKLNEQFVVAIQAFSGRKHEPNIFAFAKLAVLDTTARRLDSGLSALQELDKMVEHASQESKEIRELIRRTLVFLKYFKPGSEEYPNAIRRAYNFLLNTLETELKTTLPGLVHLIGHSHIDTAGLWTFQETVRKCARAFSSALRVMEEFPEFKFSQNHPVLYEFTKTQYPDLYKQIKKRIMEGQWEPLGSMWAEPDCNIPNGESLIRQILFGRRFLKQEFGIDSNILWLPDSFGFNWALPQILAKTGITNFYASKLTCNDKTKFPYTSFWWQGIDKSKVLVHVSPLGLEAQIAPKFILKSGSPAQQEPSVSPILQTYGYSDSGGAPTKENLEFAAVLKTIIELPASQLSTVRDFFKQVEEQSINYPTWENELYLETHRGTYTTQAWVKKENRECETLLYTSELLSTLAMLFGNNTAARRYPQKELEQTWKKLLRNQSNNILGGTAIADAYKDVQQDYQNIRSTCSATIEHCIHGMSQHMKKSKTEFHFTLFNSLCWQRSEYVELLVKSNEKQLLVQDTEGKPIAHQIVERSKLGQKILCYIENIPPLGFKHLHILKNPNPPENMEPWETTSSGIETPYYRARLDTKGAFNSIFAKHLRREIFEKGKRGNQFITFRDIPKQWEAWNIDADFEKHKIDIWKVKQAKIVEQGPLRATIRLEFRTGNKSVLVQDIRFYHKSPRIDFQTRVRWNERQVMMKVAFPFNMKTSSPTYEIQFGAIHRSSKPRTDMERAKFEVPAQQWADMSDAKYGVSLLNDCKYGHDARYNTLRLTLLRSPHYPHPIEPWRSDHGVIDQGDHTFCYALHPHSGDWTKGNTVQHARELNNPILVFPDIHVEGIPSLVKRSKSNIVIDSIKKAEEFSFAHLESSSTEQAKQTGDAIIIRMHEAHGVSTETVLQFGVDAASAIECDILENDQKQYKIVKSKLTLKFKPFEIKTLKLVPKAARKKS